MSPALHSKLRSITHVATIVHVILQSYVVFTWMRDTIELVQHVTLWNLNSFSSHLCLVWFTPLGLPGDAAYACTNIQQVPAAAVVEEEEEEEDFPLIDTWRNARVWVELQGREM